MSVVDVSALVEMLLHTEIGKRIEARLLGSDDTIHAPHLIEVEAAQALRNLVHRREIPEERAREALADLALLRVIRHPHLDLVPRIWQLKANLTAYDATYVALAEALDLPLVTCDERLSRSPGHDAAVECFA